VGGCPALGSPRTASIQHPCIWVLLLPYFGSLLLGWNSKTNTTRGEEQAYLADSLYPSLREFRAWAQGRNLEAGIWSRDCGGMLYTGLLPMTCSSTLIQPRTSCLGVTPPTVGWVGPHTSISDLPKVNMMEGQVHTHTHTHTHTSQPKTNHRIMHVTRTLCKGSDFSTYQWHWILSLGHVLCSYLLEILLVC
jgi:ABC-type nickel/cobalt efflux system permease component RcnA